MATQVTIFAPDFERDMDGEAIDAWTECLYESRDEAYRDAVALIRGHVRREHGADKVERTKWVVRLLPEKQGSYSFGLPVVQLYVTEWSHVEPFDGGERERDFTIRGTGHYVPANSVRTYLWDTYGLNLSLLSAYGEASQVSRLLEHEDEWGGLVSRDSLEEALAYFGITKSQNRLMSPSVYAPFIPEYRLWELKHASGFTADYVPLNDLAIIVGHIRRGLFDFLKGHDPDKLGPSKPALSCGIRFPEATSSGSAVVLYADGPEIEPRATAPLPGGIKGKPLDVFRKLLRLRAEAEEIDKKLSSVSDRTRELHKAWFDVKGLIAYVAGREPSSEGEPWKARDASQLNSIKHQRTRLLQERESLESERSKKIVEIRGLYRDLLRTVARDKERILGQHHKVSALRATFQVASSQWKEKRERFVDIPSPLEGLPAHMALLPAGIELPLQATTDPFGRAILKVARPIFGQDRQFPLNLHLPEEQELHAPFIERMGMIFGKRQWLLAQGITAFAQLYRANGGYDEKGRSIRITIPEWCRAMRPDESSRSRIADKGTNGLFGSDVKTSDAFHAFFGAAQAIHFPDPRNEKHTVAGLITITGYGKEARGEYVHAAMNPDLFDLMVGEGQRPMFMVTNAAAMLSYRQQELSYLPAAQFALELLARQNLYNKNTATLSSPAGDGFAVSTFMSKFGLVVTPREQPVKLKERFKRLCEGLQDKGVVATIKLDGRERDDWRATKLLITMSEDYKQAYNLNRLRQHLAREEKLLAAPFNPQRASKKAA